MASKEMQSPVADDDLDGLGEDVRSLQLCESAVQPPSEAREVPRVRGEGEDMSQSYHEIFDSQGYLAGDSRDSSSSLDTPGSVETVQVYYSEGEGKLVSVSPPGCQPPMSQYLTRKLISDTLMWQETFRNDSPSPEEEKAEEVPDLARPVSLVGDLSTSKKEGDVVLDPRLLNDIEREARRLATELDSLVETLSCALQSISGLTVEYVQTYRDGVCKTCDQVDTNIRAMYQLMAKWEELNKNMSPAYKVSSQIKDIKRLLDLFEGALG